MTDLDTPTASIDETTSTTASTDAPVEWAPAVPRARSKRRLALWIGIPAAAVIVGAGVVSMFLIAPGTKVAGVDVGLLTPGAAAERISAHVASSSVTIGGASLDASALGLTVDAKHAAVAAHDARPAWNITQWFGSTSVPTTVAFDEKTAEAALAQALPGQYASASDATVAFDAASHTYVTTPAVDGRHIDLADAGAQIQKALATGESITVTPRASTAAPLVTDDKARAGADALNGMLQNAGFYVGDEKVVAVEADTFARWITLGHTADGTVTYTADQAQVQQAIDALPGRVNRAPQNGVSLVNAAGKTLGAATPSVDGLTLGDTTGLAGQVCSAVQSGSAHFAIPASVQKAATTTVTRLLEVNLTEQRLYLKENGATVDSWLISSGKASTPTFPGRYTINSHITSQTMTSTSATDPGWNYSVPNVQWVMYFNGDQGFHGVYWHNDWGTPLSHGCVGMSNAKAKQIYDWALTGTDVYIHD